MTGFKIGMKGLGIARAAEKEGSVAGGGGAGNPGGVTRPACVSLAQKRFSSPSARARRQAIVGAVLAGIRGYRNSKDTSIFSSKPTPP